MTVLSRLCLPCRWGVVFTLALAGCSGASEGPPRRGVAGTVTYNNAPIPYGEIRFLPEPTGPLTVTTIDNGKYALPTASGVVIGKARVQINALGKEAAPALDAKAAETIEIPKKYNAESTLIVDVPAGAGALTLDFNLTK